MRFLSVNPATGAQFAEHEQMTDAAEIANVVWLADKAYHDWRDRPFAERAIPFRELARLLRERSRDLAVIEANEMGRPLTACMSEIEKCAQTCEYYADQAERLLAPEKSVVEGAECEVRFDPLGVIAAVMPWNFPYWQVIRAAAPIMMAGNVIVLKHASNVQGCATALEELFRAAGFPSGCFRNLPIKASAVEAVLRHPLVRGATVTGGEKAGRSVGAICGDEIKPVVLELGGSDAYIVLADADLDACANVALTARLQNSGQSCIAAKRMLVVDEVHDAFVEKLRQLVAEKVVMGDPLDEKTTMGPLATAEGVEEIDAQVQDAVQRGAKLMAGGRRPDGPGWFYEPTILTEVTIEMRVAKEETFGPVFAVIRVKDADEAVALSNESQFGLGAAVWTRDLSVANAMAVRLESGFVNINGMVKSHWELPVGGIKKSGIGRELGAYGVKEFVNVKTVRVG